MKVPILLILTLFSLNTCSQNSNDENLDSLIGTWKIVSLSSDIHIDSNYPTKNQLSNEVFSENDSIIIFFSNGVFTVNDQDEKLNYKLGGYTNSTIIFMKYSLIINAMNFHLLKKVNT